MANKFMTIPSLYFPLILLLFLSVTSAVSAATPCTKLGFTPNLVPFNTSSLLCSSVWPKEDFVLMYQKGGASTWNFVLSAPNNDAYIGIGFSNDGQMVGSSAVVGWVTQSGKGTAKQYYLGGESPAKCLPDQGNLTLGENTTIISQPSRLYLAFQLNVTAPTPKKNIIYAIGPRGVFPGPDYLLNEHAHKNSTTFDYALEHATTPSPSPSSPSPSGPMMQVPSQQTMPSDSPRKHGRPSITAILIITGLFAIGLF